VNGDNTHKRVVLASGNQGKLREMNVLLASVAWTVVPQSEFALESPAETGTTFVENAIIKARYACAKTGLPAVADDSGIEVDALNGAPGIFSSRYAGEAANDQQNLQKLLSDLSAVAPLERTARFRCVVVMLHQADDATPLIFTGTWEGRVIDAPRGDNGFGYDSVFLVPSQGLTVAELDSETKNRLSHRGQALNGLCQALAKG
jgi:XTP/dITP diphosphohydrolase